MLTSQISIGWGRGGGRIFLGAIFIKKVVVPVHRQTFQSEKRPKKRSTSTIHFLF